MMFFTLLRSVYCYFQLSYFQTGLSACSCSPSSSSHPNNRGSSYVIQTQCKHPFRRQQHFNRSRDLQPASAHHAKPYPQRPIGRPHCGHPKRPVFMGTIAHPRKDPSNHGFQSTQDWRCLDGSLGRAGSRLHRGSRSQSHEVIKKVNFFSFFS